MNQSDFVAVEVEGGGPLDRAAFDPVRDFEQKLASRSRALDLGEGKKANLSRLEKRFLDFIEVDRISEGISAADPDAPKKSERPSWRRHLVKKANADIANAMTKLVEGGRPSQAVDAVQKRVRDWCRQIDKLKE